MSRKIKKSVSIILALIMLCGVLAVAPVAVHAEELQVYETSTGGKYSLIPDEENPGMYVLHLIEGSFTGTAWEHTQNYVSYWDANWGEYSGEDVISITVDDDVNTPEKDVKITGDCSYMFKSYFPNCKSIDFSNADTSGIGNMNLMFAECHALEVLNIYGFKSSGRASTQMFAKCENLKELLISTNFQVIRSMQLNNGKISDKGWIESDSVDGNIVSGTGDYAVITPDDSTTYIWAASSPQYIFNEQTGVLHLISGFFRGTTWQYTIINTWESIWTALDFEGKDVLSITAGKNVKFANDCSFMFKSNFPNCTSIDLHNVDTSNVKKMTGMFLECNSLESVNLSGFDTTKVSEMKDMFAKDPNLSSLDLSSFDMNSVDSTYMFDESIELKELTISDKFIGGINGGMKLNNNQYENIQWYNGWRVKGDPEANKVSGDGGVAVITNPDYLPGEGETKTYIWIGYYDVDWLNEDGTKLSIEQYKVDADTRPTYKGATPINPDPEDTTSVFVGWVDDLGNEYGVNDVLPIVTRDTTYTARFEAPKTEYTLNYIYQGRKGGNNGGYVGDDEATDEKTYTVTVELGDSDLKESGMPKDKVLVDNAPVVNDPYKNCRWTIDDEHVIFDPETKIVTITAEQPERKYSVVFKNSNNETTDVFRVKLNDFVKKNDSFITAEETDGSGTKFAYWSVVQNNKEVARCFERKFNLRVTGDSVVTANYGEATNLVTLSDAEISRQKFTENGTTKDLLYADFITAYMNKQGMELSTKGSSEYKTGVIVQYSPNVKVEKENAPGETLSENDKITFASGDELTAADAKTLANGGTVGGKYSYLNAPIDNTKYNDKNRLNKSLVFTNTETARRLVLCAYYYVYNVKTDEIEMTAPVYFYLYDAGNAVNTES